MENLSKQLAELAQKIKKRIGYNLRDAVENGLDLIAAKNLAGHGKFLPWLRREFEMSERTARNYMVLVPVFEGKTESFADLRLETARALVADKNESARKAIFQRVDACEIITEEEVKKAIASHRKAAPGAVPEEEPIVEVQTPPMGRANSLNGEGAPESLSQIDPRRAMQFATPTQVDQVVDSAKEVLAEDQPLPVPSIEVKAILPDGTPPEKIIAEALRTIHFQAMKVRYSCDFAGVQFELLKDDTYGDELGKLFEFINAIGWLILQARDGHVPNEFDTSAGRHLPDIGDALH
jgi:hypothetical protein